METLEGRVAAVTGAASGIGLAVTAAFVASGMRVVMADRNAEALVEQAARFGDAVHAVWADVADPDAVEGVAAAAVDRFGALHVGVNNAGIHARGRVWELPLEDWHRVLDVNLWGVIHGVRSFVPRILATGDEGHVVNVASMAAVLPRGNLGPYTVAKHGVLGLSDVLRAELLEETGGRVGVSVVFPGMIRTAMVPIGTVPPETVAANVIDAIRHRRDYVYTDDHSAEAVHARLTSIIAARAQVVS